MRTNFESLRVYQLAEAVADQIWEIVSIGTNLREVPSGSNLCARPMVSAQILRKALEEAAFKTTADL